MMSFNAPSLPPSLIPECDPGLGAPPDPDDAINSLVNSGRNGFWRPLGGDDPAAITAGGWTLYDRLKRFVDITTSLSIIVILVPLFPFIALLIRATSPG